LPRLNGGFSNPSCVLTYGCEDEGESADDAGQWAGNVENFEHGFSPWSGLIPRMPALEGEPPYVTRERERKGGPLRGPRLISTYAGAITAAAPWDPRHFRAPPSAKRTPPPAGLDDGTTVALDRPRTPLPPPSVPDVPPTWKPGPAA